MKGGAFPVTGEKKLRAHKKKNQVSPKVEMEETAEKKSLRINLQ